MTCHKRTPDISPLVWLILPVTSYLFFTCILLTGFPTSMAQNFGGELGVIETAQVLFLLILIILCSRILLGKRSFPHPRLRLWVVLLMLGALYTFIEEISWGQHYFGWATPAWLADLNEQNETNLHNIETDLFFQIPRAIVMHLPYNLLLTAIYAGGLLYPVVTKGKRHSWFWPTPVCLPWALLTACSSVPVFIGGWLASPVHIRHGELQEYFVYGFLVTYVYALDYRLPHHTTDDITLDTTG